MIDCYVAYMTALHNKYTATPVLVYCLIIFVLFGLNGQAYQTVPKGLCNLSKLLIKLRTYRKLH